MLTPVKSLALAVSLTIVVSLALAPGAGAKTIKGTPKNNVLIGTKKADRIDGRAGKDRISGKAGADVLIGGKGKDTINGGTGNDTIKARDGQVDKITCGSGKDKVTADAKDKLSADCELPPAAAPAPIPAPIPTPTLVVTAAVTGNGVVTSSTGGISCPSDCEEAVNQGDSITLTASPGADSTFTGWTGGGCSGLGACVVTMSAATLVTATFELNSYTLFVGKAGGGGGTVTSSPTGISCGLDCTEDYQHGTVVTLTASADIGSVFTGWSGGGCSGIGTCVVTMAGARSVTAIFF